MGGKVQKSGKAFTTSSSYTSPHSAVESGTIDPNEPIGPTGSNAANPPTATFECRSFHICSSAFSLSTGAVEATASAEPMLPVARSLTTNRTSERLLGATNSSRCGNPYRCDHWYSSGVSVCSEEAFLDSRTKPLRSNMQTA